MLVVTAGPTDTEFFEHLLEEHGELPWGEGKPVSPERVARATIRAIERGRHEIVPSWRGWLMRSPTASSRDSSTGRWPATAEAHSSTRLPIWHESHSPPVAASLG